MDALRRRILLAIGATPTLASALSGCAHADPPAAGEPAVATAPAEPALTLVQSIAGVLYIPTAEPAPPTLEVIGVPLLAPRHATWLRATHLPPGETFTVWSSSDPATVAWTPWTTAVAGPDGSADLRVSGPVDAELLSLVASTTTPDRVPADQPILVLVVRDLPLDHPGFAELFPGTPEADLVPGARMRACVPEAVAGSCATTLADRPWAGTALAAASLGRPLPTGVQAAICDIETAFPLTCCAIVTLSPDTADPGTACTAPVPPDWAWDEPDTAAAGRPFTTAQGPRSAALLCTPGWCATVDPVAPEGADGAVRAAIAARWTTQGLAEHASVASFARFTLELLAHGAPAALVQQATAAQADEIRHAEACFAIASRFAGAPVGPGAFPLTGGLDRSGDLAAVVRAAVLEGCVDETISAEQVRRAAERTADPAIARALATIADDEARHAELSWAFVRWAIEAHPALTSVVRDAFTTVRPRRPRPHVGPRLDAWGLPSRDVDDAIAAEVLATVIRPCADALLGETSCGDGATA